MKKCNRCGIIIENENSNYCIKCGAKLTTYDNDLMQQENDKMYKSDMNIRPEMLERPKHDPLPSNKYYIIAIAVLSVVSLYSASKMVTSFKSDVYVNEISQASVEIEETSTIDSSKSDDEGNIFDFDIVGSAEIVDSAGTFKDVNDVVYLSLPNSSAANVDEDKFKNITSERYSLYDVFTDVEAVSKIIADYSDEKFTAENFLLNIYSFDWELGYGHEYDPLEQFSLSVYCPGYHDYSYRIVVPISKIASYLRKECVSTLLPHEYNYIPLAGNTPGNYINFSEYVTETDLGIPYGVIYGGSVQKGGKKVENFDMRTIESTTITMDRANMVLYEFYGDEYEHCFVYYRNCDDNNSLYRIIYDGTQKIKLTDFETDNERIYKDIFYYSRGNEFWKMNKDGSNKEKIIDDECYMPSFYKDTMYCISSDRTVIDIYDLNSGEKQHCFHLCNSDILIKDFFIQDNILIARASFSNTLETAVFIYNINNGYSGICYKINSGAINADDEYIYISYEKQERNYVAKVPIRDFANKQAVYAKEVPKMQNSSFSLIEYGKNQWKIYQDDESGNLKIFELSDY